MNKKPLYTLAGFTRGMLVATLSTLLLACGGGSGDSSGFDSATSGAGGVTRSGSGVVDLSWTPPTTNADGSGLSAGDLAGYRIYFGTDGENFPNKEIVASVGVTDYRISNLPPATYFFRMTAFDTYGNESGYSNVVSKMTP